MTNLSSLYDGHQQRGLECLAAPPLMQSCCQHCCSFPSEQLTLDKEDLTAPYLRELCHQMGGKAESQAGGEGADVCCQCWEEL